jgi:hypothetical protein
LKKFLKDRWMETEINKHLVEAQKIYLTVTKICFGKRISYKLNKSCRLQFVGNTNSSKLREQRLRMAD